MGKRNQYNRSAFPNPIVLNRDLTAVLCNQHSVSLEVTGNFVVPQDASIFLATPISGVTSGASFFTGSISISSMCNGQAIAFGAKRNGFMLSASSGYLLGPNTSFITTASIGANTGGIAYKLDTFSSSFAGTRTDVLVLHVAGALPAFGE